MENHHHLQPTYPLMRMLSIITKTKCSPREGGRGEIVTVNALDYFRMRFQIGWFSSIKTYDGHGVYMQYCS
jgi:hypothetical protein